MLVLPAQELVSHGAKDRRRFWVVALLIHLVIGAITLLGVSILIADVAAQRKDVLERDASVAAATISCELIEFEYAIQGASMMPLDDLVRLHVGASDSSAPGRYGNRADAVLASYVCDSNGNLLVSWGNRETLTAEIRAIVLQAVNTGESRRCEWTLVPEELGSAAWVMPVMSTQQLSSGESATVVDGAYVVVVDLQHAVDYDIEMIGGVTGRKLMFEIAGGESENPHTLIETRAKIEGTPYVVHLEQSRIEVASEEWPFILYAAFAAFSVAGGTTFGYGMLSRARRQRDTERFARELLTERVTSEDRFLAAMSHEMRTPLNSIIGFAGVMLDELAGPISDEQRRQLWMIERSGRRLLALVTDVLDASRIRAGQVSPDMSRVDAVRVGSQALEIVEPLAAVKSIELVFRCEETELLIESDAGMIERILLNLLSNAVKFSEEGTVALEISREVDSVHFRVSDQGSGVPVEELDRLGEEFYQAPRSSGEAKPEGIGLGLPIAFNLARVLGGRLLAQSEEGVGSLFTLVLPTGRSDG